MGTFIVLFMILQCFLLVPQTHGICFPTVDYILNGKISYHPSYSYYQVSCNSGFSLKGKSTVLCENNEWENPPPICIADTPCSLPKELKHGTVVGCTSQNVPKANGKCYFKCNSGYTLIGPSSLICTSSGEYVDEEGNENYPECKADSIYRQNAPAQPNYQYQSSEENAQRITAELNPCSDKLGGCQHICKNYGGTARCRCFTGFDLAKNGKNCIETDSLTGPPKSVSTAPSRTPRIENGYNADRFEDKSSDHPCLNLQCAQLCIKQTNGLHRCRCSKGFILNKDKRSCDQNLGPPIQHRNRYPCAYSNGGCAHKCTTSTFHEVICSCHPGYDLAADGKRCILSTPKPPLCPPGYKIDIYGRSCIENRGPPVHHRNRYPCAYNNGGCTHKCTTSPSHQVICSCHPGYDLAVDGKRCILSTPKPPFCPPGYKIDIDGRSCIDINECEYEHLNDCHHRCENTEGGYTCHCEPGYILIENNKCEGCRKNSFWSAEENGCVDCPPNSFTKSVGKSSISDCICNPGFVGSPRDDIPCLDVNECENRNFGCSHTCVNIPGDAFCSCPSGLEVDKDNKTCIDIDECSVKNGGCDGICHNTVGSFRCECPTGFIQSGKDQYSCDDVDECLVNNGGCEQLCVNYRGGYYCTCQQGYRLDSSLKNCTDVSCQALPIPHFSKMTCEKEGEVFGEMDHYPSGTVCKFDCILGFKDASESNKMKCKAGKWKGHLGECIAQHCPPLNVPENGDVHPASCAVEGNAVKQKCTFTCRQGYKLKGEYSVFNCKNSLSWRPEEKDIPICVPEEIRASIECTRNITVILPPGKSRENVTIPEPVTNMENYEIEPNVIVGKPIEFEAGRTRIKFTASSPSSNRTAKCLTIVNVLDEESPVFLSCPDSILIENAKIDGEVVTWEEPEVVDNVEVESLQSSVVPNTTLTPGSYIVEYVARDAAGNTGTCSFKIDIVRLSCDNLTDPVNGNANCMDWLYGKLCQPQCEEGFIRDPTHPMFYSCGDSGIWKPGDVISDCLPYTEAISSDCPEGSELKIIEETEEEICLECPSNTVWSSKTRKCEK